MSPLGHVRFYPVDDLAEGRSRGEDRGDTGLLETRDVGVRNHPTAEHDDIGGVPLAEQLDHSGKQCHVCSGESGETDGVNVLLDCGLDDLLGGLVETGVDDLVPGIAKRSCATTFAPRSCPSSPGLAIRIRRDMAC